MVKPSWDDPKMFNGLDRNRPWGHRLRRHQSWYREHVLGVDPVNVDGRPIPNRVRPEDVAIRPALNFLLDESILQVVENRLKPQSPGWRGRIDKERLRHNLLTSQALCFNLFGYLGLHRQALTALLRDLDFPVDEIMEVRIEYNGGLRVAEWRPNSAFDAWVLYRSGSSERFLGIECKYHEDLTAPGQDPRSGLDVFRKVTASRSDIFLPGTGDALAGWSTRQLWFNACLALAAERDRRRGTLILASCRDDKGAEDALESFLEHLNNPSFARSLHYENVIEASRNYNILESWAQHFHLRYLTFAQSGERSK